MAWKERYMEAVDVETSYRLAKEMESYRSNPKLGYRPAGSRAEFETGERLKKEMEAMGLSNVRKDEILVDGWEFEKAELTYKDRAGNTCRAVLGAYQTDFVTEGEESFDLVFLGKGTARDYEGKDVRGKLVVVEINQRNEWWINFPVYQACEKGAKALIAVQDRRLRPDRQTGLECPGYRRSRGGSCIFHVPGGLRQKIRESLDEKGEIRVGFERPFRCHEKCADLQYCRGTIPGKTAGADDSALSPLRFLFQRFPG